MPTKKQTTKKPKAKQVFYPCQFCNKGLKSVQGKIIHEKSCGLNPKNKEQKLESSEIAKTIPEETEKKMEEKLNPLGKSALESLEQKQKEIVSEDRPLSPEEQQKMQVVLDFVQEQKNKQLQIDDKKTQINLLREDANLLKAQKELKDLQGSGGEIFDEKFQSFIFKLKAMEIALGNKSQDKTDNTMVTQLMQENRDVRKQNFDMLLSQMKEAKESGDIEKFTQTFENMKKLSELFGEKESGGASAVVQEVVKSGMPFLVELGKKAVEKKEQQQNLPQTYSQNPNPNSPSLENPNTEQEESPPAPEIEQAPIIPNNPGNPDSHLSDEEYLKKHRLEMEEEDNPGAPFLNMYSDINENQPQNKSSKMTA